MADSIQNFASIHEFEQYINNSPLNEIFRWKQLHSSAGGLGFTGTKDMEEALQILKEGWTQGAEKIEASLKLKNVELQNKTTFKNEYNVAGFQASVPRYLQGIPQNMINQKRVVKKVPVITLVKNINYGGGTSSNEIIENSVKALQIVQKIEAQGTRVNLDIIAVSRTHGEYSTIRIRIKNAGERLNVSKVAFPMAHPSMLRRLEFRSIEVSKELKDRAWYPRYGSAVQKPEELAKFLKPNEYLLNSFIPDINVAIAEINSKSF
jgi:hypothetical protein